MSDAGCTCSCMYEGDYESPSVWEVKVVKARHTKKPHVCCECGATISPGESYERASGLWEDSWGRYKTCLPCARIRDDLCRCGFIYGRLRETICEDLGFDYVTGEFITSGWWKGKD